MCTKIALQGGAKVSLVNYTKYIQSQHYLTETLWESWKWSLRIFAQIQAAEHVVKRLMESCSWNTFDFSAMYFFKTSAGGGDIVNRWPFKNPRKKKPQGVRLGLWRPQRPWNDMITKDCFQVFHYYAYDADSFLRT